MKLDFNTTRNLLASFIDNCLDLEDHLASQAHLWSEDNCNAIATELKAVRQNIMDTRKRIESFNDSALSQVTLRKQ